MITVLKSKIYKACVTDGNLNYEGSITIDTKLMDAVDLVQYEKVLVVNMSNNARYETYVIEGKTGSREIVVNGAAVRDVQIGDRLIIMAWETIEKQPYDYVIVTPRVICLDENNNIT